MFDPQPHLVGDLVELRPLRESDFAALHAAAADPLIWEQHPASDRYREDVFRAYLEDSLSGAVEAARRADGVAVDGALTAGAATHELVGTLARAGPFGAGNPEPIVALPAHTIVYADEVGQAHVRARLRAGDGSTINAVAFRAAGQPLGIALACLWP